MRFDLEAEVAGYIGAQHWTGLRYPGNNEEPEPLDHYQDSGFDNIPEDLLYEMEVEVRHFLNVVEWGFSEADLNYLEEFFEGGYMGHNFSLTKQHHGTGFWDRSLGDIGDRLTELSQIYPETTLSYTVDEDCWVCE